MPNKTQPVSFVVREGKKRTVAVEWRIADVATLTDYLYWAFEHGARYQLRVVKERPFIVELVPESGAFGEYSLGLRWDYEHGTVYRQFDTGLHYVTHHAFDGMPRKIFDALDRAAQIIRVESVNGLFALSLDEWWDYCSSGRNDRYLAALGASPPRGAIAPDAHLEEDYELRVSAPEEYGE
jgi:hypothetical protein